MSELRHVDVVIVGAGPAGSVCGCLLKKAGVDCLVVDHATFPRDKICGGGLTSKAWHLLESLMPELSYDYNPVYHLRLDVDGKAHCEFKTTDPIRIVQRKEFDYTLLRHYQELGGQFQKDARMIKVAAKELTIPLVSQKFYRIKEKDKDAACVRLLDYYQPKLCLIFCNTKKKVDELYEILSRRRGASPFGSCPV